MKHISNKLIGFALLSAAVVACTDEYDCNLQLEKPVDAEVSEYLASFDLLKTYITRTPESPFQLTSKVSASEFGTREVAFSTILNNLDGADVDGSFSTASCLQDNGSYSVVDMKSAPAIRPCNALSTESVGRSLMSFILTVETEPVRSFLATWP